MRFCRASAWGLAALAVHGLIGLALPAARASRTCAPLTMAMDVAASGDALSAGASALREAQELGSPAPSSQAPALRARLGEARSQRARRTHAPGSAETLAPAAEPASSPLDAHAERPADVLAASGLPGASARVADTSVDPGAGLANPSDGARTPGAALRPDPAGAAQRGPNLLAFGSPCAGLFPAGARASHGEVQLALDVDTQGRARASAVLAEQPGGQGFGSAARACAPRLVFSPAVTRSGAPVPGQAKVKLRFDRR